MKLKGVRKATLARALKAHPPAIDCLLSLGHGSSMDTINAAFRVLGKTPTLKVVVAEARDDRLVKGKLGAAANVKSGRRNAV